MHNLHTHDHVSINVQGYNVEELSWVLEEELSWVLEEELAADIQDDLRCYSIQNISVYFSTSILCHPYPGSFQLSYCLWCDNDAKYHARF